MLDVKDSKLELCRTQLPVLVMREDVNRGLPSSSMSAPNEVVMKALQVSAHGSSFDCEEPGFENLSGLSHDAVGPLVFTLGFGQGGVAMVVVKTSMIEASRFWVDNHVMRLFLKIHQAGAVALIVKDFMQIKGYQALIVILRMKKLIFQRYHVRHFAKS